MLDLCGPCALLALRHKYTYDAVGFWHAAGCVEFNNCIVLLSKLQWAVLQLASKWSSKSAVDASSSRGAWLD